MDSVPYGLSDILERVIKYPSNKNYHTAGSLIALDVIWDLLHFIIFRNIKVEDFFLVFAI